MANSFVNFVITKGEAGMNIMLKAKLAMMDMQTTKTAKKALKTNKKIVSKANSNQEVQCQRTILIKDCMGLE